MATIDSLEIQIQASARSAWSELDKLISKVGQLENALNFDARGLRSLNEINGENIRRLGGGMSALASGMQRIKNTGKINFDGIARGTRKLSEIPAGNLSAVGNAMRPLADGINALASTNIDNQNLQGLINSLTRLSSANLSNLENANFTQLGNSIKEFANAVSGASKVEQSTIAMTNAVAKLADAGKNIGKVTGALPHLATRLKEFMNTMSDAPQVANETIAFANAIGTLASAGDKTKATASNLGRLGTELKNFMQTMATAPNVSESVIRMTSALSGLVGQSGRVTLSANSLSGSFGRVTGFSGKLRTGLRNLTGSMTGLGNSAGKTAAGFKSFLSQLTSAAGVYFSIYGAIRGLKSAIDISSDLTEVQNVVDVAFGNMAYKVEEFSKVSVKDFGMSELTAKQIAGRYQAMSTAIGISADKIGQANTFLSGQTKGYVAVSDSMADVSINLTKLAADMASFYNVEQTDVAKSLESIFTGTTAPLRRYGLDLTQATLAEWAMKQGLDADISSMSQAEKTMLRYQYVLANTKAAQGDFARTADSWANQTRVLAQQFEVLGSVIGGVFINAFKPLVKTLNAVMGKVISFAKTVSDALGTIFGWTFEANPGGITNDGFEDMSSGIDDVADSAKDASDDVKDTTKKVKELKENLQSFDKLHVISLDKDDDSEKTPKKKKDKDKGKGDGTGAAGGLDTGFVQVDSILKKYDSDIDTLYKLGEYIGSALTDALNSIEWDKVYAAADRFGSGLAEFLNGLISPELFSAVGNTVAGALNTALHVLDSFGETFDWTNFGESLNAGLVAFLKGIDWETALSAASNWGTGIATALNNFISPEAFGLVGDSVAQALKTALVFLNDFGETFEWENFGESLAEGLTSFLDGIDWETALSTAAGWGTGIAEALNAFISPETFGLVGESVAMALNAAIQFALSLGQEFDFGNFGHSLAEAVNRFFKTFNFENLAESINVWAKGLLDALITFLEKTEWYMIGEKIGTFLAEIDFLEIGEKVGRAIWDAINDGVELFIGMFSKAPIETALITAFAALKITGISSLVAKKIKSALGGNGIASALTNTLKTKVLAPISGFFTSTLIPSITGLFSGVGSAFGLSGSAAVAAGGGVVVAGVVAAVAAIKDLWDTSEIFRKSVLDAFDKIKTSVSNAFDKVSKAIKPILSAFSELGKSLSEFYQNGFLKPIIELFATLVTTIGGQVISTAIDVIADAFSGLAGVLTGAVEIVSGVLDALSGIANLDFDKALDGFKKIGQGIIDAFSGIVDGAFDIGADIIMGLLKGIVSAISGIGSWIKKNIFDPFIKGFKNAFGIHSPSTVMIEQGKFLIQGLINGIKGMVSEAVKAVGKIKDEILKKFNDTKKKFKEKGQEIVSGIKTGISDRWNDFISFFTKKKDAIVSKFSDIKSKFLAKGKEIIEGIKSGITNAWDGFVTFWTGKKTAIINKFNDIKDKFLAKGGEIISGITDGISGAWKTFSEFWTRKKNWIVNKFKNIKGSFLAKGGEIISGITSGITGAWKNFSDFWTRKKNWIVNKFKNIKGSFTTKGQLIISGITQGITDKWKNFSEYWGGKKDWIVNKFASIRETFASKGKQMVSGLKEGVAAKWSEFTSFFGSKIKGVVNGVIGGINWVLDKLGSKKKLSTWDPKWFAKGSSGLREDTVGVVNDQKGATYRELIVPPHGKPFIPKGRNVMLPLEKGTKIMPADETKRFVKGLPHFEGGVGEFLGNAWEKVKNFTGEVWDYISEPKKIVQIAIDKFTNLTGMFEPVLSIAKGAVTTIADGALGFVKKIIGEATTVNYKVGAGVQQWKGLAAKALQITGQFSPANLSYLLQQMQHESTGNPMAINLWDSNAKKGTPSKGLMQVIDPTFRAYAKPPYNKNIYDPLSNMIASIRYAVAAYGSLYNAWAKRNFIGYKSGIGNITISDIIPGYASGGFPASGQLFMARENGTPEMVGKIGSRTAVANNEQITSAVAESVYAKLKDTSKEFEDIMNKLAKSIEKSFEDAESKNGADKESIKFAAGKISEELKNTLSSVEKQFSETGEVSRDEMQSLLSKTKAIIEQAREYGSENAEALKYIYQDITTMASSAFDKMDQAAQSYNDFAKKIVNEVEENVDIKVKVDEDIDEDAYEAGQNAVSGFTDGARNYISKMENWADSMRESAAGGFDGISEEAQICGYDAVNGYTDGLNSGYDDAEDTAYGISGGVAGGFSGIEEEVYIDGANVVVGLQNGMAEKWEELSAWLSEKKEELLSNMSDLEENMKPVGEGIVNGLAYGMESMWNVVEDWSQKIKDELSSVKEITSQAGSTKKSASSEKTKKKSKNNSSGRKEKSSGSAKKATTMPIQLPKATTMPIQLPKVTTAPLAPPSNKKYKAADLTQVTKGQKTGNLYDISGTYNKTAKSAGNLTGNQIIGGVSAGVANALNQSVVPALQKIGGTKVELVGEAKNMFKTVVKENNKYKTITGASAFK